VPATSIWSLASPSTAARRVFDHGKALGKREANLWRRVFNQQRQGGFRRLPFVLVHAPLRVSFGQGLCGKAALTDLWRFPTISKMNLQS
jgi:hypothetical protein